MILEAFSEVLHREWSHQGDSARDILHRWLLGVLVEAEPKNLTYTVIHTEICVMNLPEKTIFAGRSDTGHTLLRSLYLYCDSFERWQFGRWLHSVKPHSFTSGTDC